MSHLKSLQTKVLANKTAKGFDTEVETEFLLLYGEVAEAYEAWRQKKSDLGEELADVLIYLLGLAEILGFNLDEEVTAKMEKNAKRTYVTKNGVLVKEGE